MAKLKKKKEYKKPRTLGQTLWVALAFILSILMVVGLIAPAFYSF